MSEKLNVQVYGQKYTITTSEDPEYVRELAQEIDGLVRNLMLGTSLSANQALLLAALNYLDLYKKLDSNSDRLRRQISEYDKEASRARAELAEVKKDLGKLSHSPKKNEKKS